MTAPRVARRLRFRYDPATDESAIGAFVAACGAQWLRSTASGLEGAGIGLNRPGFLQVAPPDDIFAAASAMRTDPALLAASAFATGGRRDRVALGDLVMPRAAFEFERRRIGPLSLLERPHHRLAWLNLLLPYCPETLEKLVQDCDGCGPLGWRQTRGIAHCETCGERIAPSSEVGLDPDLTDDYRLMAHLMSREPAEGERAVLLLPTPMHAVSRTTLVNTALRSAIMFGLDRTSGQFTDLVGRPPAVIAAIACEAARLLRHWPEAIREAAAGRIATMGDDRTSYRRFLRVLRGVGDAETGEARDMMAMAFPIMDGRSVATMANDATFYSPTETSGILSASSAQLRELRDAAAIRFDKMPSGRHVRARYEPAGVEEIARQIAGSVAPETGAIGLDVPVYAIGQFVAHGLLETAGHPAVTILRGRRVLSAGIEELRRAVLAAASPVEPTQSERLSVALRRFAGEKPWAATVRALLSGLVPFSVPHAPFSIRALKVDPVALAAIGLSVDEGEDPLGLSHISMRDACEIVGAPYAILARTLLEAGVAQERVGRARGVEREALSRLGREIVCMAEIVAITGKKPVAQSYELRRIGAQRRFGVWCRRDLIRRGVLAR